MKISIILPAYNEESRIRNALDTLIKYLSGLEHTFEIIVSADGSTDDTTKITSEYSQKHSNVILAAFQERLGKGGGILNAAQFASGDVLIIMDVDMATPPDEIPKTIEVMEREQADIIYGSRNLPESIILIEPPFHRKILGKVFNYIFRLLLGINLHDTQCGYKAIRKEVFDSLQREINIEGFAYDIDLAVKAQKNGYKLVEMPVTWSHVEGSKVNVFKQIFEMGRDLLIVWLEGKKREVRTPKHLGKFYDSVPGDVYSRASKSWFLPRRLWHKRKNEMIIQKLPIESDRILDAGFGSGTLFDSLLEKGKQIYGLDIGNDFVRFVHDTFGNNVDLLHSDVGNIPFLDEVMDCVICSEVLEHVQKPADVIKEFYRVLRPSGTVLITTPNISLRWAITEAVWTRVRREIIETEHVAFTRRRLRYYLLKSGFRVFEDRVFMGGNLNFVAAKKITEEKNEGMKLR
jgi:glycosyltransferase involved in cell wall biosynthesis